MSKATSHHPAHPSHIHPTHQTSPPEPLVRFHGLAASRLHEAMEVGSSRNGLVLEDRDVVTWLSWDTDGYTIPKPSPNSQTVLVDVGRCW